MNKLPKREDGKKEKLRNEPKNYHVINNMTLERTQIKATKLLIFAPRSWNEANFRAASTVVRIPENQFQI